MAFTKSSSFTTPRRGDRNIIDALLELARPRAPPSSSASYAHGWVEQLEGRTGACYFRLCRLQATPPSAARPNPRTSRVDGSGIAARTRVISTPHCIPS
jgi:hypothetical protein